MLKAQTWEQVQLHETQFKNLCLKSPFRQNEQLGGKQRPLIQTLLRVFSNFEHLITASERHIPPKKNRARLAQQGFLHWCRRNSSNKIFCKIKVTLPSLFSQQFTWAFFAMLLGYLNLHPLSQTNSYTKASLSCKNRNPDSYVTIGRWSVWTQSSSSTYGQRPAVRVELPKRKKCR